MAKVFSGDSENIIGILNYNEMLQEEGNDVTADISVTAGINEFTKKYPDELTKIHYVLNKHKNMIIKAWRFPNKNLIADYLAGTSGENNNFMDYLILEYYHIFEFYFKNEYLGYIRKYSNLNSYPNMIPSHDILSKVSAYYDKSTVNRYLDIIKAICNNADVDLDVYINSLHLLHRLTIDLEYRSSLTELFDIYIKLGKINVISKNNSNVLHYLCMNNNIHPETKVSLIKYLYKFVDINSVNKKKYKPFDYYKMNHRNKVSIWKSQISNMSNIKSDNYYSILS